MKSQIVFDEKVRLGIHLPQRDQNIDSVQVYRWWISDVRLLRFTTPTNAAGDGIDDGRTVVVQALHHQTSRTQRAEVKAIIANSVILTVDIEIVSDQVPYQANIIEAPYVGFSLSTPQLYLLTNIGYQVFKNSMLTPRILESVQVAAVLQNTFSVGMYMSGSGDFPITMNDADSSNLTYTLCDANYHPIKLLSPMYVVLKVEPTPNPNEDISQWNQLLPRVRKPQVPPLLYQIPKIDITQHPNLLNAWLFGPDII
jgi:hypothetical protein